MTDSTEESIIYKSDQRLIVGLDTMRTLSSIIHFINQEYTADFRSKLSEYGQESWLSLRSIAVTSPTEQSPILETKSD